MNYLSSKNFRNSLTDLARLTCPAVVGKLRQRTAFGPTFAMPGSRTVHTLHIARVRNGFLALAAHNTMRAAPFGCVRIDEANGFRFELHAAQMVGGRASRTLSEKGSLNLLAHLFVMSKQRN